MEAPSFNPCQSYNGTFRHTPGGGLQHALTLIELLVVIAILAILAALLLPALGGAKAAAKRTQCVNNHRHLAIIWTLYAGENNDLLAAVGQNDPPSTKSRLWIQGAFVYPEANTNSAYLLDPKYALFADYLHTIQTYVCPADPNTVTVFGKAYPKLRSYALNAYLGWAGHWDDRLATDYRVFKKQSQLVPSMNASMFLFTDVHPKSICWPLRSANEAGCIFAFSRQFT